MSLEKISLNNPDIEAKVIKEQLLKELERYCGNEKEGYPFVKSTKKVISVYDLYEILINQMEGLEHELEDLMLSMKNYCKYNKSLLRKLPGFKNKKDDGIISSFNKVELEWDNNKLVFNFYITTIWNRYLSPQMKIIYNPKNDKIKIIYRDNKNYITLTNKEDLECIEAHLDDIKTIINKKIIETDFFGKERNGTQKKIRRILETLVISGPAFKVSFDVSTNNINPIIENKILHNLEENGEVKKIFGDDLTSFTMLKTKIYDNREVIFKRMSVYIPYLSQEVQDLIRRQRYKQEEQSQKETKPFARKKTNINKH